MKRSKIFAGITTFLALMALSLKTRVITFREPEIPMADELRSNGKIYVVVAVIVIILIGLLTYVLMLDKKISKLEKEIKSENQEK